MRFLIPAALSLVAFTPSISAQMMGQSMDAEWVYSSFGSTIENHTVTVTSGIELPSTTIVNDTKFDIDIGNDWIEFQFNATSNWTASSFNGWLFRDSAGLVPSIQGYTVDSFSAGVTNTAGITTGFNSEECWANFGGMQVAGPGDWIRLKVNFGGPVLSITNLIGGQSANITVTGTTTNGAVGLAYSLFGPGPTNVFTGSCGIQTVNLSPPIQVIGTFSAIGNTMSLNMTIPAGASGLAVWVQALDFGSCQLSNGLSLVVL